MGVVGIEAATGNDTMDVGMEHQGLSPGVEDGKETDLGTEPFRVGRNFNQGVGHGTKQQVVECDRVVADQGVQFVREGEHDMEIGDGQ